MRVAFLAGHLSHHASGVRQMIEGLSGALARRGVELRVFGIRDAAWENGDSLTWRGAEAQTFRYSGPAKFGYMPELAQGLADFAPDLVHLHGIWMHYSAVAGSWAGAPGRTLVISPHGMLAPRALAYSPWRKRVARALFQDRCFARAAGYHATAESEAGDIRAVRGEVPVRVIPLGIDDTPVHLPEWQARARRVLAIGRLHPIKGYDRLLRAWAQIEPRAPGWTLEIAGPDPDGYGDALRRLVGELGIGRATIGPARYGVERDKLIANSRLFALPSLTENFALTVPEALVCGTPVMASTGAPWDALPRKGCGWWVDPSPDATAKTLTQALSLDDDELAAMGARGRDWALETYGWARIAADMADFYTSLRSERMTT